MKIKYYSALSVLISLLAISASACSLKRSIPSESAILFDNQNGIFTPTLPNKNIKTDDSYQTILEEFNIINKNGEQIHGLIRRPNPELYPSLSFAGVIKVPGGINPGRSEALTPEAIALAEAGMVVVTFNAEGRSDPRNPDDVTSDGKEDYNGFRNQDTLAEIFIYTTQLPYVISENIGFRSQSYGITMAAGCAARHPELDIKYIVDGEGPPSSFETVHEPWALYSSSDHPNHNKYQTVFGILNHYSIQRDSSAENLAFWKEREAIRFIGEFDGMYLRLQGEWDHSQPPSQASEIDLFHHPPIWWHGKHTCDIVNAAIDGGVPWVRVNPPLHGNPINEKCDLDRMPNFIDGELNNNPMIPVYAVIELANAERIQH